MQLCGALMQYRGLQPTDRICTLATQITGGRPAAGRECESTARRCETNYRPTGQRTDQPTVDNSNLGKPSGDLAA